ncbi:MAG: 30S ribosome-binding factor RbfA [Bryobacteraceae bacterium]
MDERRAQKVSETLREELTEIIGFEMADPRLDLVDITDVRVSPDLRHATVRVALGGDRPTQDQALETLDRAKHFLRRELARRLSFRRVPELHFQADTDLEPGGRLEVLLRRAKKTQGKRENP